MEKVRVSVCMYERDGKVFECVGERERERERRDSERVRKQGTLSEGEADLLIKAACFIT